MSAAPLPAHARALRDGRTQAERVEPFTRRDGSPGWRVVEVARFVRTCEARAYADEVWPDAVRVSLVRYSARDGWQPHHAGSRVEGVWS